jgi:hypothetical protein
MSEAIDTRTGEVLPAVREVPAVVLGTVQGSSPAALVASATAVANELAEVIRSRRLASPIQGREYVRVEGWTTLATLMGCLPREVANERKEDDSYVSTVELVRMSDGAVLTRASAECGADEDRWMAMPPYARRSMAATRATSKVCRIAFSWVMALAGYETTPAEEMDGIVRDEPRQAPREVKPPPARPAAAAMSATREGAPTWLGEKVGIGKKPIRSLRKVVSECTWSEMANGSPGGERCSWMGFMLDKIHANQNPSQSDVRLRPRLEWCLAAIYAESHEGPPPGPEPSDTEEAF